MPFGALARGSKKTAEVLAENQHIFFKSFFRSRFSSQNLHIYQPPEVAELAGSDRLGGLFSCAKRLGRLLECGPLRQ
jgi:hypothetical protein